jgi:hypothetical protein
MGTGVAARLDAPERLIAMRDTMAVSASVALDCIRPLEVMQQSPGFSYSRTNHQHVKDDAGSSIARVVPWGVCVISGVIVSGI